MSRSCPEIVLRVGRKLLHGVLKLRGIALHLALDAAHRLCEEILCLIKVLLVLRPLLGFLHLFGHLLSFAPPLCSARPSLP